MLASDYDEHLMSFVPDYKINLIEPASLSDEDLAKFTTDFGCVMEFLKYSSDKRKMQKLLVAGSPFENISTSAALVLNSCANMKININQNKETTDMCKAIQEMQQEAVDKAVGVAIEKEQKKQQEAIEKAIEKNTASSLLKTARALMETLHLSAEQALKAMKVSESECATLKPMLQV